MAFVSVTRVPASESRRDSVTRVSCGSRTHLSSLEGWHLCRSAKDTLFSNLKSQIPRTKSHIQSIRRKERELNPQGIAARRFSRPVPSPVGLPFHFQTTASIRLCSKIAPGGAGRSACMQSRHSFLPPPTTSTTRLAGDCQFTIGRQTLASTARSHRPCEVSCGGRNRTCVRAVNSRQPVPAQAPPQLPLFTHHTAARLRAAQPSEFLRLGSDTL